MITFYWTNISMIEDNAFFTQKTLNDDFVLNMLDNRLLSGDSFAEKAFSNIHKPTTLYLGQFVGDTNYWNTPITYLPEKTFLPLLKISDKNQIQLQGENYHLDCNDCRNAWLKNNPKELKKVNDGFLALTCANKKKLDDEGNFKNCTILY